MNITLIDNWPDFYTLSDEWDLLLQKSSADTIFLTWDWVSSWVEIWQENYKPYVLLVRDENDVLIGVAPFYIGECRLLGLLKYSTLRIIGDVNSGAEYPAWMVKIGIESDVSTCIAAELSHRYSEWDFIWMPRVAGWINAHQHVLQACKQVGLLVNIRPADFSTILVPQEFSEFEAQQSRNRRQQMRRRIRKVFLSDDVEILQCVNQEDVSFYLDQLFSLNNKRWNSVEKSGTFYRKPQEAEFYRKFIPRALKNGWLSFFLLRNNEGVKAVQVGYVYKNIFHQLQEGFDPDFLPGTGTVLRWHIIKNCIQRGVDCYDFLGGITEHKRRWGAIQRVGHDVFIGSPRVKNNLILWGRAWPTGKYLSAKYPKHKSPDNSRGSYVSK
jgi:CelD/BcsL family acetyltransferase involved in cellulose biosynthesis